MRRRPPRSTRTDTLFPYTTLFRSQRQRRIFLTERAVGADGQQPLAAPPPATCDRQPPRRRAYIDETATVRSEEHTSELPSLMRISYAVFCLKTKTTSNGDVDRMLSRRIQGS